MTESKRKQIFEIFELNINIKYAPNKFVYLFKDNKYQSNFTVDNTFDKNKKRIVLTRGISYR